jgi:hypothetical protein
MVLWTPVMGQTADVQHLLLLPPLLRVLMLMLPGLLGRSASGLGAATPLLQQLTRRGRMSSSSRRLAGLEAVLPLLLLLLLVVVLLVLRTVLRTVLSRISAPGPRGLVQSSRGHHPNSSSSRGCNPSSAHSSSSRELRSSSTRSSQASSPAMPLLVCP